MKVEYYYHESGNNVPYIDGHVAHYLKVVDKKVTHVYIPNMRTGFGDKWVTDDNVHQESFDRKLITYKKVTKKDIFVNLL